MASFPDLKHEDTRRLVLGIAFVAVVWFVSGMVSASLAVIATILSAVLVLSLFLMHYHRAAIAHQVMVSQNIQDLQFLHSRIELRKPLPYLTGWSASPSLAARLYSLVLEEKPEVIVELGSGASTVVMAYAAEKAGTGRIISVDHDEVYAEKTQVELRRHRLDHLATVIHTPLARIHRSNGTGASGEAFLWYDLSAVTLPDIDLLVVDGPPRKSAKDARLPAFDQLASRLSPGAIVVLDDSARSDEKSSIDAWTGICDAARSEDIPCEKGVSVRYLP